MILHFLIGPVVGRMVDRVGPKRVMLLGCFMSCLGLFLSSLIQLPWQYYLSFGFLTAAGLAGTGWVTNTTIIHYWFKEKRGLPTGIISSGIGVGILLCVPTTQYLIDQMGWRMTYRILAGVVPGVIALMAIFLLGKSPSFVLSRPLEEDRGLPEFRESEVLDQEWESQHWTVRRATTTRQFRFLFLAFFLGNFTSQTVFTHQVVFFVDRGMDALSASYIMGLVGITSVGAKILLGTLSDRIGREAAYTVGISFGVSGVLALIAFNYLSSPVLLYFYAFLFAMGYAVTAALPPVITGDFFGGSTYGRIFGTLTIANGLGGAFGAWLAGLIYDQVRSYLPAFLLVIVCFLLASYCIWKAAPRKIKTVRKKRLEFISTE
jgi:MFS family permease